MEEYIFNCYMKYQKENNPSIMKRLMKFPREITILLVSGVVFMVVGIVLFLLQKMLWSFIFIVISMAIAYVFNWRFELYQIKNSEKIAERHKEYCIELENWLCDFCFWLVIYLPLGSGGNVASENNTNANKCSFVFYCFGIIILL